MKLILAMSLALASSFAVAAKDISFKVFSPSEIMSILGQYPERGSALERNDYDVLRKLQDTRTEEECVEAGAEAGLSLVPFFAGRNGPLTQAEVNSVTPRLLKTLAVVGANVTLAKKMFKRPRPYDAFRDLVPCVKKEKSYAYPSGHAAMAFMLGHKLVRWFPERAAAIHARAQEVAWNRVLGGVHHPSDIVASEKLINALIAHDPHEEND